VLVWVHIEVCRVHMGVPCRCTCVWGCTMWVYMHVGCAMQVCVCGQVCHAGMYICWIPVMLKW